MKVRALVWVAFLTPSLGCSVEQQRPDWDSGGDHKRDLAKLAPLNRAVTDSVNASKGDNTDWKYITVPGKGKLRIKVSVDNPTAVATMMFVDALGQPLGRERLNGTDMVYNFEEDVDQGKYFVQVQTSKFETVYTVKNEFEPEKKPIAVAPPPARPERPDRTRRPPPRRPDPPPRRDDPDDDDDTSGTGTIVVVGKVLNKIAWDDGKKTRITFNKGESHGVKRGAVAEISGGPTMRVKEVFEEASVGFAKVKPSSISQGTRVVITVKGN